MFLKTLCFFLIMIANYSIIADEKRLIIASTTSTNDTGLLNYLNKEFNKEYDIKIHVLALGTGQAIKIAEQGNAEAQCNLALMYIEGNGVPELHYEAVHWINLAYKQGSNFANEIINDYDFWPYIDDDLLEFPE